ncbi:MAG TPA: catalase-related domain-containing protein, partial [Sphaerochaeta sp.]|nr:catalase-related domain-containing protein [Sphaerochaeta sp.]
QPGKLFNLMGKEEQQRLFDNTARNMEGTTLVVKKRHIRHCYLADPAYGEGVAKALGIDIADVDMNDTYGARA